LSLSAFSAVEIVAIARAPKTRADLQRKDRNAPRTLPQDPVAGGDSTVVGQCDPGGHRGASRVADFSKGRWLGTGTTPSFAGPVKRARAHSRQNLLRPGPGILARSQDDPQILVEARDHIISVQRVSS
jgi:hypothetical protein